MMTLLFNKSKRWSDSKASGRVSSSAEFMFAWHAHTVKYPHLYVLFLASAVGAKTSECEWWSREDAEKRWAWWKAAFEPDLEQAASQIAADRPEMRSCAGGLSPQT